MSSHKHQGEKSAQDYAKHPPTPPKSPNMAAKEAPPSYAPQDPTDNGSSQEELCAAFATLNIPAEITVAPTPETCLAHLKLLHCFHSLKEDIGYADGLFGIWDARAEMADNREDMLGKLREKRWSVYIARAVERFEDWWLKFLCPLDNSERLECKQMFSTSGKFTYFTATGMNTIAWTKEMLPPIGMLLLAIFWRP